MNPSGGRREPPASFVVRRSGRVTLEREGAPAHPAPGRSPFDSRAEGPHPRIVIDDPHAPVRYLRRTTCRPSCCPPMSTLAQKIPAPTYDEGAPLQSVALRDPRLSARVRVVGEDATEERQRHEGEGLALQLAGTIPIGHEQAFASEGAAQLEGSVIGDFHILGLGVGANIGFRHRFAEPRILGASFRNELFFGVGVQVPAFFIDDVVALLEVNTVTDAENSLAELALLAETAGSEVLEAVYQRRQKPDPAGTVWFLPRAFASYIARSASVSSSSGPVMPALSEATPMLARTSSSRAIQVRSRSASRAAWSPSVWGSRTTNSSPP